MRLIYDPILISLAIVGTFLSMGASAQSIVDVPGDQLQLQTTSSPQYLFRCAISTNKAYQWQVRACASNKTCSNWATGQTFTTSRAPEVASPYDSDWQSKERARDAAPVLDWCPAEGAVSYFLELYQKKGTTFTRVVLPTRFISPTTIYDDNREWQEIKKATIYGWQVTACPGINTLKEGCGPFSQFWEFDIGEKLNVPTNLAPPNGSAVNLSTSLTWLGDRYAAGYLLHIQGVSINKEIPILRIADFFLNTIWNDWLLLDSPYNWRVASCEGSATSTTGLICEDATGKIQWSNTIMFRTTGAPPTNIKFDPVNSQGQVGLPLTISWDDMPGAASYTIEVRGIKYAVLQEPKLTIYFEPPFLQQGQSYITLIRTCADEEGLVCGLPAGASFTVAPLEPPVVSANTLFIPSIGVHSSEVFGASAYQFQLRYESAADGETAECKGKVGSVIETTIVGGDGPIFVRCAGQYSLQGRGCIENTCAEPLGWGQWSSSISLLIQDQPQSAGLIPCGRGANNPSTPWDERESCGVKHIFLLIKIILDFLMFRLAPLAIAALALYSGIIFYFALPMGVTAPVVKVKSLWKAASIGLLIMFFAWIGINTFLGFVGFNVGVFGNWYGP